MFYELYEMNHALLSPYRAAADATRLYFKNPLNPLAHTMYGRSMAAAGEVFERLTRRYGKPSFDLDETVVAGETVPVRERAVWRRPFCKLLHFQRQLPPDAPRQPNMLIVAPMSGHYATLLRGTVEAMLPDHEVYITDWADARMVPLAMGRFDLDTYIDYLMEIYRFFRGDVHVVAVCQPAVPVFASVSLMEAVRSPFVPKSMTLMGGPIDPRVNPTVVTELADGRDLDWFRRNVIMKVPFPHPGFMRDVYPGFLQLSGFISMNIDRHVSAHREFFDHLVRGDGDSAEKHREFYDEYLSVMDLTAEFYLQTVDAVFIRHALAQGEMMHHEQRVDPSMITRCALFTIEGEKDDISGLGQTEAAHRLAVKLPAEMQQHHVQPEVGHYGVFNGSRYRREIAPRIGAFIRAFDAGGAARPAGPAATVRANGHGHGVAPATPPAKAANDDAAAPLASAGTTTDAAAAGDAGKTGENTAADAPVAGDSASGTAGLAGRADHEADADAIEASDTPDEADPVGTPALGIAAEAGNPRTDSLSADDTTQADAPPANETSAGTRPAVGEPVARETGEAADGEPEARAAAAPAGTEPQASEAAAPETSAAATTTVEPAARDTDAPKASAVADTAATGVAAGESVPAADEPTKRTKPKTATGRSRAATKATSARATTGKSAASPDTAAGDAAAMPELGGAAAASPAPSAGRARKTVSRTAQSSKSGGPARAEPSTKAASADETRRKERTGRGRGRDSVRSPRSRARTREDT